MGEVCKTQNAYFSSVNQAHTRRGNYLTCIIAYCEHPRGLQSCPLNTGIALEKGLFYKKTWEEKFGPH